MLYKVNEDLRKEISLLNKQLNTFDPKENAIPDYKGWIVLDGKNTPVKEYLENIQDVKEDLTKINLFKFIWEQNKPKGIIEEFKRRDIEEAQLKELEILKVIEILKQHNLIRQGKMLAKPDSKELTQSIDFAIQYLSNRK